MKYVQKNFLILKNMLRKMLGFVMAVRMVMRQEKVVYVIYQKIHGVYQMVNGDIMVVSKIVLGWKIMGMDGFHRVLKRHMNVKRKRRG